jgi:hypothetical protein
MEIDYITEPEAPFPYEAWDALNGYISGNYGGLSTEGLSMEGYKETLRHLWEKLVEYLKKIISWVKEKTMSDKRRLEQTREQCIAPRSITSSCRWRLRNIGIWPRPRMIRWIYAWWGKPTGTCSV